MHAVPRPAAALALTCVILAVCAITAHAQAFDGYTFFAPNGSRTTYLIDMKKTTVHTWTHAKGVGYSCYLLPDGSVLRSTMVSNPQLGGGGATGIVERVSWEGAVLWNYTYSSSTYLAHHDICAMPNGNVILIAWEVKTAAQAVAAGLKRSTVIWPDHLVEVQPTGSSGGNIVWQWHAWDHLVQDYDATKANYGVVADHPELFNINMGAGGLGIQGGDWMHINGLSYNAALDQIVISSHTLNEVYVIDHSTTTAEAATHAGGRWGKGGDILYRWGMPANYGAAGSKVFDVVHCAVWIPEGVPGAGHIMAFNNGATQRRSVVVELAPPVDGNGAYTRDAGKAYGPASPLWSYTASDFFSNHLGSNQRLPNGNTFMVESTTGNMVECDAAGAVVWTYAKGGEIVRAMRYAPTYPGVQKLTGSGEVPALPSSPALVSISPNPVSSMATVFYRLPERMTASLIIFDALGREVATLADGLSDAGSHSARFDASAVPAGVYYCRLLTASGVSMLPLQRVR
jgi:hypothetical protein